MIRIGSIILSYVVNPLLLTTFLFYVLTLYFPIIIVPNPVLTKLLLVVLFIVTFLLPVFSLLIMKKMGVISDIMISIRAQRMFPLVYTAALYIAAGVVIFRNNKLNDFHIAELLFLAAGLMLIAGVITQHWKISAHALGAGAIVGVLLKLVFTYYGIEYIFALVVGIIVSGFVMSARLYLGAHTLAQVIAGFFLGAVYAYLASVYIL